MGLFFLLEFTAVEVVVEWTHINPVMGCLADSKIFFLPGFSQVILHLLQMEGWTW